MTSLCFDMWRKQEGEMRMMTTWGLLLLICHARRRQASQPTPKTDPVRVTER